MIETNIRVTWHSTQTPTREAVVRRGDGKQELVCALPRDIIRVSNIPVIQCPGTGEGRGEERDAHFTQNSSIPAPLHSKTYTDPAEETHTHQQGSVSANTLRHSEKRRSFTVTSLKNL